LIESRDAIGGTWDLFRYPGIRSDSDMFTLGYSFKPWLNEQGIADGALIRNYIRETADEHGIMDKIQFGTRVTAASWSSEDACWTLELTDQSDGSKRSIKTAFIMSCTGYYNYSNGYEPVFEGKDSFKGQVIHPQHWPEDLDYDGKRVVVVGSGATAVTLVPAMADKASHITMLQRSPSYVMSMPKVEPALEKLRTRFSPKLYYRLVRARNITMSFLIYRYCRYFPERARNFLQNHVREAVGPDFDMRHFTPDYNPWDERVCAVTDGDMFNAIKRGGVSVVTDHIERFTEDGILLKSGEVLEADIIITATGLNLQLLGGMTLEVDGKPFDVSEKMCYRGVLLEDLPNMGMVFGYTNASWTLKADLVLQYICRVLNKMKDKDKPVIVPRNTGKDPGGIPFIDLQSGYVARAADMLPQQGQRLPWRLYQNYLMDFLMLRFGRLEDGKLQFENSSKP
jgi:cation diffusion facilitator CzcD-associated flavoprotein CzcO